MDKTLLIRDILESPDKVFLFTRPRRFGKTLNMDMLRVFLEKSEEDNSVYFKNRNIWHIGTAIRKEQGKYPVIFLTFKGAIGNNWSSTLSAIADQIASEYKRHPELENSSELMEVDRQYYRKAIYKELAEDELRYALLNLCKMLYAHHHEKCFLIIDEYDAPIQASHMNGFYDEAISFIRLLFSNALKTNEALKKGILTGILRIAKESLFSGLNNIRVYSVLDRKFSQYFGFTHSELEEIAMYYGAFDKLAELESWYDGYDFGGNSMYNPWSVACYFNEDLTPGQYWVNTGENPLLREMLEKADADTGDKILALMKGESVRTFVDTSFVYSNLGNSFEQLCSLMVSTGYLRAENPVVVTNDTSRLCDVSIPDLEVAAVWKSEILSILFSSHVSVVGNLKASIITGETEEIRKTLSAFLLSSVSFHDVVGENFYHGLLLGLVAVFDNYRVKSNRESGLGRFDIMLLPQEPGYPGIIIEVKALKNADDVALHESAKGALEQIRDKRYDEELRNLGVDEILSYGVAFSGKKVDVMAI